MKIPKKIEKLTKLMMNLKYNHNFKKFTQFQKIPNYTTNLLLVQKNKKKWEVIQKDKLKLWMTNFNKLIRKKKMRKKMIKKKIIKKVR